MADDLKSWSIPAERLQRGYTASELFVRLHLVASPEDFAAQLAAKALFVNGTPVSSADQPIGSADLKGGKIELKSGSDMGLIEPVAME